MKQLHQQYQERDKVWLVGVYWSIEKHFLLNLQQDHKKMILETLLVEM